MRNIFFGLFFSILLFGCALESDFGLPNNQTINNELIGTWKVSSSPGEKMTIKFYKKNAYKLIMDDDSEFICFSTLIKGFNIMNVIVVDNEGKTNFFYGFKITGNTLEVREVSNEITDKKFNSANEILSFFKENIERKDFFNKPKYLIKSS